MSDRPTPETDAEIEVIRNSIKKEYQFDWAIEVARKLERERDEARELVDCFREKHDLTPMCWNV